MYGMSEEDGEGEAGSAASLEDVLNFDSVPPEGLESAEAEAEAMDGTYEYAYRMAPKRAHGGHRSGYGAGAYYAGSGWGAVNESDYVMVDAHVLASPTLADINGDGHMEVSARSGSALSIPPYHSIICAGAGGAERVVLLRQGRIRWDTAWV